MRRSVTTKDYHEGVSSFMLMEEFGILIVLVEYAWYAELHTHTSACKN